MKRRNFIRIGALGTIISGSGLTSCFIQSKQLTKNNSTDILIVGGTPAGIMAAIAAARLGAKVTLTEYHGHLGGMSTSGLGKSDIENKEAIVGLFKEFTQKVLKYYVDKYGKNSENVKLCKEGYYYEPSVAELIFNEMIDEQKNITVLLNHQIEIAEVESDKIKRVVFLDRTNRTEIKINAHIYIDATYEGDLYALAGASYRVGREGRTEFNEEHAGQIFFDYEEKVILDGSTGQGDDRLPAYTYRLCMTDDPDNSYVLIEPPSGYNRENYTEYFQDLEEGRLSAPKEFKKGHGYYPEHFDTMVRVFSFTKIPNRKYDVNINPRPLGFPFVEENYKYPEANWQEREKIFKRHRELTLGLIYFIQNDPKIPPEQRKLARQYHLPLDEFTDNKYFPWQLYIREARRLKGQYILTENDVRISGNSKRNTIFNDSVITGEFPIDSFPVSNKPSPNNKVLEGYIGMLEISPYQIPYRIMIPQKVKGLIVPVAASATHIGFSTLRMEPLWMGIGQVAGIGAHLALNMKAEIKDVPVHHLQKILIDNHQIITYFKDVELDDKAYKAVQFWGAKGFFDSYFAKTKDFLTTKDFQLWLNKFNKLLNVNKTESEETEIETVSISIFLKRINQLGADFNIWKKNTPLDASLSLSNLDQSSWFYNHRETGSAILRGEACLALYDLFFAIFNKNMQ